MIRAVNLKKIDGKPGLIAVGDLELPSGLILRGCSWRDGPNGQWIALPSRSYTTASGETKYTAVVEFSSSANEARKRFQAEAVKAFQVAEAEQ